MMPPSGNVPNIANYQPAPNGGFPAGPGSVYAGGQTAPQLVELQRRAQELDANNRQLTAQVAQIQQQSTAYRERAELLARQLEDTNRQNAQLLASAQQFANQARNLQTSMESRGGARLTANSSLQPDGANSTVAPAQLGGSIPQSGFPAATPSFNAAPVGNNSSGGFPSTSGGSTATSNGFLQAPPNSQAFPNGLVPINGAQPTPGQPVASGVQIPGTQIVQDRNAIRIRIASDQLFAPGSAQLNPAANSILENFIQLISRQYPRQKIGVEVHTDAATPTAALVSDGNPILAAQGKAIVDSLLQRGIPLQQLMLTNVGAAQPIADNQTPTGRALNRRIELVIYQN